MSEKIRRRVRQRRVRIFLIVLSAVLLLTGLIAGYLYLRETTLPIIGRHACETKSFISDYQNAYSDKGSQQKANEITKRVTATPQADNNATCVYMQLRYEATYGKTVDAKKKLELLRTLMGSGKKVQDSINDLVNHDELYKTIDKLGVPGEGVEQGNPQYVEG